MPFDMNVNEYIAEMNELYSSGIAKEHSYRLVLQRLLTAMLPNVIVINDGARIDCGAPDFQIIEKHNMLPLSYIETKQIGDNDLEGKKHNKVQFSRYKSALGFIIFTDFLSFLVYEDGTLTDRVELAELKDGTITIHTESIGHFESIIFRLAKAAPSPVRSATMLAEKMAAKARMLEQVVFNTLQYAIKFRNETTEDDADDEIEQDEDLMDLYEAFKSVLIDSLTTKEFADLYAQTVTYGLFAARIQKTEEYSEFSRLTAGLFIPKTYPLLKQIFQSLASSYAGDSYTWIIDDLVHLFRHADVRRLVDSYYNNSRRNDPMIRFYEDFLRAYDPKKKDLCGVYYTPQEIVDFIVGSVDDLLKERFELPLGLADYSKVNRKVIDSTKFDPESPDGFARKNKAFHRVQILDPATGTGTFLAETVKLIYDKYKNQPALWQKYVENELFPRLNGFEFMMAPYSIAHIKIDLVLAATGFKHTGKKRLNIYLADSLKEPNNNPVITNFAYKLSREIKKADRIKREKPIMVMMGNPPYNGESINNGPWIKDLIEQYKREPGFSHNIDDTKWVNDDYVKFIRLAQDYIERGGTGIVAYINPHGYLDNPTFRGMRYELLKAFDEIRIINLHGNSKKKEHCPDGSKDENVFNIQQGVCINIFVKTGKKAKGELGKVYYADVWGKKRQKLDFLKTSSIRDLQFTEVISKAPRYYFMPFDTSKEEDFFGGINLAEMFDVGGVGMCSKRDSIAYKYTKRSLRQVLSDFKDMTEAEIKAKYDIQHESRDQKVSFAQNHIKTFGIKDEYIFLASYRPFDKRFTYFTNKSKGFIAYPVYELMHHLTDTENLALIIGQQGQVVASQPWNLAFITDSITDLNVFYRGGGYVYPLYVTEQVGGNMQLKVNIKPAILQEIETRLGETIEPHELVYYIYAMLYSNRYRETYKAYLDYNFPHIPFPHRATYHELAALGKKIAELHLMRRSATWNVQATYNGEGKSNVTSFFFEENKAKDGTGKVIINDTQYFDKIPKSAYNFNIGGYQPLQKWLKDRKNAFLTFEDIRHYEEMVYAITETMHLMEQIDKIY